jgi:hypothetical protein
VPGNLATIERQHPAQFAKIHESWLRCLVAPQRIVLQSGCALNFRHGMSDIPISS